jgi:hypothetical protein
MKHSSTPEQRVRWVSELIVQSDKYGVVSQMSRSNGISRQTLYSLKARGEAALSRELSPKEQQTEQKQQKVRAILTLFTEAHASYRGIQACLETLLGMHVSIGEITAIIQDAGKRAQELMEQQIPKGKRAIALDEQYGSKRGEAYLNIVDVHSGQVLASVPPVSVDGESWTILLWLMQEEGLKWYTTVSDGGKAIQDAVQHVNSGQAHQRDVWHVLNECQKVQGRLDRFAEQLKQQTKTVENQAARVASGKKPRGKNPKTDVAAHTKQVLQAEYVASSLSYLTSELKGLLEVVVLSSTPQPSLLSHSQRLEEIETLCDLVRELCEATPAALRKEIEGLLRHVELALPALLVFSQHLDALQQSAIAQLGEQACHLIGWAWQRRAILEPKLDKLITSFPPDWQPCAASLLHAWEAAVRASSCVENWHSVLRPYLSVHRTLSAGMLALLALWHNHRVAPRGVHKGQSPIQRSGLATKETTDWLVSLGYPPHAPERHNSAPRSIFAEPEHEILAAIA